MSELRLMWGTAPVGAWVHDGHLFESIVQTVSDRRLLVAAVLERHWDDFPEVDLVVGFAIDGSLDAPQIDLAEPIVERVPRGASSRLVALARLQLAVTVWNAPDHARFDGRVDLRATWPSPRGHLIIEDHRLDLDAPRRDFSLWVPVEWGVIFFDRIDGVLTLRHFDDAWSARFSARHGEFSFHSEGISLRGHLQQKAPPVAYIGGELRRPRERRAGLWSRAWQDILQFAAGVDLSDHPLLIFERSEKPVALKLPAPDELKLERKRGAEEDLELEFGAEQDLELEFGAEEDLELDAEVPAKRERAEREHERERAERERAERERAERERAELARTERERAERERDAHERAERERIQPLEQARLEAERAAREHARLLEELRRIAERAEKSSEALRRDSVPPTPQPSSPIFGSADWPTEPMIIAPPPRRSRSVLTGIAMAPIAVVTAPIAGVLGLVRGARELVAERAERRLLAEPEALADAAQRAAPPWATAYRPSWVLPLRQSSIHVYVVLPEAQARVDREAHQALDAAGNPAERSHPIPLWRAPDAGEPLTVDIELADFDIGRVEPIAWRPPYIRFVVPICAHAGIALGVHRPRVTVRSAGTAREALATFDFDLDVRARTPRASRLRMAFVGGCATAALAVWAATSQHALPPAVGWPTGAVCFASGVRGAWPARMIMVPAETRDRATVFVAFAPEDRERVKRAIQLMQARQAFPALDAGALVDAPPPISALARADRCFVFWSAHARASSDVARACAAATERAAASGDSRFVAPVLLDHDRPDADHLLARLEPTDLGSLADVLIVTAVKDEYQAVLGVDTGAVPGSAWQPRPGPTRLEVAFRDFAVDGGVLRIAVTQALGMGGINAVDAAARLIDAYGVRCLAMCGVCAGRRGDVELGDVIIADRLWQYDTGKRKVTVDAHGNQTVVEQADIDMYKIRPPEWLHAAERFALDPAAPWLAARPRSHAVQGDWILERIFHQADPATDPAQPTHCADYDKAIARLWKQGLLRDGTLELTDAGRAHIARLLTQHRNQLPEPRPLRVHVGPIASGNRVMEDADIFPLLADSVRKVLGVEMEAAAIGTLAHTAQLPCSVVMKAVMDHADPDKSDNFKPFAARASAECLIAFLRANLAPRTPPIP